MAAAAGLSKRGAANVDAILPSISAALLERTKPTAPRIDLSTAENWLMRNEIIEMTKDAIAQELKPHVCCEMPSNHRPSNDSSRSTFRIPMNLPEMQISYGPWQLSSISTSILISLWKKHM
jgi:hypothetical protein